MDRLAIDEWIAFSDMDIASAKHLCSMNPKPLEIILRNNSQLMRDVSFFVAKAYKHDN